MNAIQRRLAKLEKAANVGGDAVAAAKSYARLVLTEKTGQAVADGPLLDRLTAWGAQRGVSLRSYLASWAKTDPLCVVEGHVATPAEGVMFGHSTDIHGKTADELLTMLDAGLVDENDLLTLHGLRAA